MVSCSGFVLSLTQRRLTWPSDWNLSSSFETQRSCSISLWNRDRNVQIKAVGGQLQHSASWISVSGCCGNGTLGGRAGPLNWTCSARKSRKTTGAIQGCTSSFAAVMRETKRINSLTRSRLIPNYVFSWREIKVRRRDFVENIAALH